MILTPTRVSTDRFTRVQVDSPFPTFLVAEESDLGRDFRLGRVYDDACDVGFTLVSARTGREIVMALEDEHRDPREGELLYTDFVPARRDERGLVTVRLYND